jgi:hypothetical protein
VATAAVAAMFRKFRLAGFRLPKRFMAEHLLAERLVTAPLG